MKSMSFDLRNRISRLFFHLALQNLILARKLTPYGFADDHAEGAIHDTKAALRFSQD